MKKDYRELYEKITNSDWFKKAYHNKSLGECPIVVEELEESEDERIRKELMCHIQGEIDTYDNMVSGDYDSRDKEDKKVHSMLKRAKAYLEKQKENPKNANSIPADCVSNAKCPYKIHGEGEFVGDIRDTPAYWRGWDDAMKQKAQKPDTRDADDLQLLGFIYDLLNEIKWKDSWAMSKEECLRRLNDYRPQKPAEWSEEDEIERDSIIEYINSGNIYATSKVNMISWLKSLRPSWKPTEEQMEALESAVKLYKDTHFKIHHEKIVSLYEQLKKLM